MTTNLEFLNWTYTLLRRHGLVDTKADFSRAWAHKSASYLTSMTARKRSVPNALIGAIAVELKLRLAGYETSPHLNSPYSKALNLAYQRQRDLLRVMVAFLDGDETTAFRLMTMSRAIGFGPPDALADLLASPTEMVERLGQLLRLSSLNIPTRQVA